jgi:hypothetical protein
MRTTEQGHQQYLSEEKSVVASLKQEEFTNIYEKAMRDTSSNQLNMREVFFSLFVKMAVV